MVDEEDREVPAESVGEVLVRGSCVTPGYFENRAETDLRIRDGWLRTGDLGLLDRDGRLFITGRKKDLIIVNGKNFYAHDIAAKIEELPFVRRGKTHVFSYNLSGQELVVVMTVLEASVTSALQGKLEELKTFLSTEPGSWLLSGDVEGRPGAPRRGEAAASTTGRGSSPRSTGRCRGGCRR